MKDELSLRKWLICGPFPRSTLLRDGLESFEVDYLHEHGGEESIKPYPGLKHSSPLGEAVWREWSADENGYVDFIKAYGETFVDYWQLKNGVAYAYTELHVDRDCTAVFLFGSEDYAKVWVNGKLVHVVKVARKHNVGQDFFPVKLTKGVNRVLVKVFRLAGRWGFSLKYVVPRGKIYVNKYRAVLPDLPEGREVDSWASVPVLNLSDSELYVKVRVIEDDLFYESEGSDTAGPGEITVIPFKLVSRRKITASDQNRLLKLSVEAQGEESILELKLRFRGKNEWFLDTYLSEVDKSVQPYGVYLPESYSSERKYPLIIGLHGFKGSWYVSAYAEREWCIIVAPSARGEIPYREIGSVDVFEVLREVKKKYSVSSKQVYLTGHSMGGYGTWLIGLRYPHLFAAIAPLSSSGEIRYIDKIPGAFRKLYESYNPVNFIENALNLPVFISHGSEDKIVPVEASRKMYSLLRKLGYQVVYEEIPGKGHTWSERGPYWGLECIDRPTLEKFFQAHMLIKTPSKIVYVTDTIRFNKAYWIEIKELQKERELAKLYAEVDPEQNKILIKTVNIAKLIIHLEDLYENELLSHKRKIILQVNSEKIVLPKAPSQITIKIAGSKALVKTSKGYWIENINENNFKYLTEVEERKLAKKPGLSGPIADVFNKPFVLVYGTLSQEEVNREAALCIQKWWFAYANGRAKVIRDKEVDLDKVCKYNLILLGNHESNEIISKINEYIPIHFKKDSIVYKNEELSGDLGLITVYPNPLNSAKYVLIVGGTTPEALSALKKIDLMMLPDYVIYDPREAGVSWKGFIKAGFYNKYWRLD
ncbi:MAG: hypothetical protein DRN04_02085 [Thermoprotei archaeon]|nr:MAG: hypothetical protein DRN04_02085 [Thermoprotei archaeon]